MNAQPDARGRQASYIVGLLFVGYLISFADRIVFSLVLKPLKVALALTDAQAGLLVGLAFAVSFGLFSPLGGFLVDRCRRKPVFAFAILFWSGATSLCGLSTSFLSMFIARSAVGVGEALLNPLAVSLIGDMLPKASRAKAFGIYFSAAAFGIAAINIFGGLLLGVLGTIPRIDLPLFGVLAPWQVLFLSMGVPGVILAIVILAALNEPPRQAGPVEADGAEGTSAWAFLRAHPRMSLGLFAGYPLLGMSFYTVQSWMVVYFDRVHGWPSSKAAPIFGLTSGLALIAGCLLAGHLVAAVRRRGYPDAPLRMCLLGGVMFSVFAIAALLASTPEMSIGLFTLAFFWGTFPTVTSFSAVSVAIPGPIRARLTGLTMMSNGIFTNTLGPYLVGLMSDRVFTDVTGIKWSMASVAVLSATCGGALMALGLSEFRRYVTRDDAVPGLPDRTLGAAVQATAT